MFVYTIAMWTQAAISVDHRTCISPKPLGIENIQAILIIKGWNWNVHPVVCTPIYCFPSIYRFPSIYLAFFLSLNPSLIIICVNQCRLCPVLPFPSIYHAFSFPQKYGKSGYDCILFFIFSLLCHSWGQLYRYCKRRYRAAEKVKRLVIGTFTSGFLTHHFLPCRWSIFLSE